MLHLIRGKAVAAIASIIVLPIIVGIGCSQNHANVYVQPPCNMPDTVSFKNDVEPIFELSCDENGCHSNTESRGRVNLEPDSAYYNLFENKLIDTLNPYKSQLYERLTSSSSSMPPGIYLDNCSINTVLKWIQQGAKNN